MSAIWHYGLLVSALFASIAFVLGLVFAATGEAEWLLPACWGLILAAIDVWCWRAELFPSPTQTGAAA